MHPSLVNIHVNHPPEATVQIHQVARVKTPPDSSPKKNIKNSLEQLSVHSVQQRSQPNNSESHSRQPQVHRRPMTMGRCFQETADGQVGRYFKCMQLTRKVIKKIKLRISDSYSIGKL